MKDIRRFIGFMVLAIVAGISFLLVDSRHDVVAQSLPSSATTNLFVHGTVVAALQSPSHRTMGKSVEVALPDAKVFLVPISDRAHPIASTVTDLSGRFVLKTPKRGVYNLCVEADGFNRTCSGKEFFLRELNVNFGVLKISQTAEDASATLFGTLRLRDGRLPRGFYPFLGINAFPTAELITSKGSIYRGFVNNLGEYVIPAVPTTENFTLRFKIDNELLEQNIDKQTGFKPNEVYEFSSIFANSAPQIHALTAMRNDKPVQVAAPGSKVKLYVVADDKDNDKLEYRWILPEETGLAGSTTNPELVWTVPNFKKNFPITVVVSDGRGGYASKGMTIDASSQRAKFSGTVLDPTGKTIEGAQIDVNGRLVNTNSKGWFNFDVPISDRYVLNIRKPGLESSNATGFGTASFIYQASVQAGQWTLRRAQVSTVDPTQPIKLEQKRNKKLDCLGPLTSRINWTPYLQGDVFDWQDGRGNSQALVDIEASEPRKAQNVLSLLLRMNPALAENFSKVTGVEGCCMQKYERRLPCGPGIKVEIPENSLVEVGTNLPPNGKIQVALSSVNLNVGDQMPGDYTVVDSDGKVFAMESFGAGSVEIGTATKRYNLKPGATATVTIPVDATQLVGGTRPPSTIPLLYYNEKEGVWYPEGVLTLTGAGSASAYTAKVKHFSAINADILKNGQSCVAIEVDSSLSSSIPFKVEFVLQPSVVNPGVIQVRELSIDTSRTNVIYNLPNNSDIVLTPIISGVKFDGSSGNVPAGVFVVNTGGPQTGGAGVPIPNADGTFYAELNGVPTGPCASRVTLKKLNPPTLAYPDEFLQGLFFQSSNISELAASNPSVAASIEAGAISYYQQADPRNLRDSLTKFIAKNKFGQPLAPNEVEWDAQYANSGDLGFGRNMHCRRNEASDGLFDYACYVTNFGQPPKFLADKQDADDTSDLAKADATVAMEFSRIENPPVDPNEFPDNERAVKFFVYNTSQPDNTVRILKADLDGHGERPVPQLCMVCHGGNVASVAADPANPGGPKAGAFADRSDIMSMRSNFLPFDLHFFTFPNAKNKASQQAAFKKLNTDIVRGVSEATTTGDAIVELIDTAFYKGGSATQLEREVIAGWEPLDGSSNRHKFYQDVLGPTCRTCHIAQPFGAPTFTTHNQFESFIPSIQDKVCGRKIMPHAQRTNDIFWQSLSPNMPAFLELYGQTLPGWASAGSLQCGLFYQPGTVAVSIFQRKILKILQNNCESCHGVIGGVNQANFATNLPPSIVYNQLLNVLAKDGVSKYIVPNNPGASKLYQRISSSGSDRMPPGSTLVSADQQEILNWINSKAPGP